mgnify:CR=1 FL=1
MTGERFTGGLRGAAQPTTRERDGDRTDPCNGTLPGRGRLLEGLVVRARAQGSAMVKVERLKYDSKYERYQRRSSRIQAHSPASVGAQEGDAVTIMECRPLSKTKSFVIIERRDA